MNPKTPQANIRLENDWPNCKARIFGETDLVECLHEIIRCRWALPFGNGHFCKHPSAKQFAISEKQQRNNDP